MENQSFASNRSVGSFKRTTRRSARKTERSAIFAVLRGVLVAAAITIIGVAVFALILNWWNASDRAITAINQVVKFVSILAGVTTAMHAGGERRSYARRMCRAAVYGAGHRLLRADDGAEPAARRLSRRFGHGAGRGRFVRDDLDDEEKGISCNACYRNGGNCVQKDDMTEIREKMLAADVIVLASPIYFYTMTAQMEAGDIRQTDAPEQAYRVGKSL